MAKFVLSDFQTLRNCWDDMVQRSNNRLFFSSPDWSELWWQHFGAGSELYLGAVEDEGNCIGIVPLRIKDGVFHFIGSDNLCDFMDFVIEHGKEDLFFRTLLSHIASGKTKTLDLSPVLPDSSAQTFLATLAQSQGMQVSCSQIDVTVVLDLPGDLQSYLSLLTGKQRHELLRKERRLGEEGKVKFRISQKAEPAEIDTFIQFFRESREDKNRFLSNDIEMFFRAICDRSASNDLLQLGILELNDVPVAVTLGFNYQNDLHLYNSGYNPDYSILSVGLISKYYHIRNSIETGKRRFDFLKGNEQYKYHLGGKDTPVFRCIINCI
jgi:CelD/BcsL family acetyltransferase involved in cellulose biosynthesis